MGRKRRGGYFFETYAGDHPPYHVHVYKEGRFIGRFDMENQRSMDGEFSAQVLRYLEDLGYKKVRESK